MPWKTLDHIYVKTGKTSKWNIQHTMKMNFMSSRDSNIKCLINSKSYKEEIMTRFDTEEPIEELLNHFYIGIK